jgi:xylose isomerase
VSAPFFSTGAVRPAGDEPGEGLAYEVYDPDLVVGGKRMEDHLRIAVCYWHSFCSPGDDVFGRGTWDRPWLEAAAGDPMGAAEAKLDAAFELFSILGTPYFCFHDFDLAPEGATLRESRANLDAMADKAADKMDVTGVRLLWGTANLFGHPRYAAGAATNPDPDVFVHAAAQVRAALEVTHRLDGQNYVLWGGREGYDTLLNTSLKREGDQLARFLTLVAEHKAAIGFTGTLLIEPKPHEPTKHQYDHDAAAIHGFLDRYGLVDEFKLNIEANHATLAGHSFHHEVTYAVEHGLLGSIDANRGDPQNGWDTDQFPDSVEEIALVLYEILRSGGLTTGGFNFDAKLRRQSLDRDDLVHAHVGGIDTLARALLVAQALVDDGVLDRARAERYAGWAGERGSEVFAAGTTLASLADAAEAADLSPQPVSGRQERLENEVSRILWETR